MFHRANEQILMTDENLVFAEMRIKQKCLEGTTADCTRVLCVPEVMEMEMFLGQYMHFSKAAAAHLAARRSHNPKVWIRSFPASAGLMANAWGQTPERQSMQTYTNSNRHNCDQAPTRKRIGPVA